MKKLEQKVLRRDWGRGEDIKVEKRLLRMWGCTGETEVGGKGKDRRKDGKKKSQKNKREEEERGG